MGFNFPSAPIVGEVYPTTPAAGVPMYKWDGEKWTQVLGLTVVPSNADPLMDGIPAAGSSAAYARGDHRHPSDSSRAPLVSPVFTGTMTTDTLAASGNASSAGTITANNGRVVCQMAGATVQPTITVHSQTRANAMGFSLDATNRIAFSGMDGGGVPGSTVVAIDGSGNLTQASNTTVVLGRAPTAALEAATKAYVDTKVTSSAYLPLAGGSMTGNIVSAPTPGNVNQGGWLNTFEVRGSTSGGDACITLHRPGAFACNFCLATDNNFYYGGWSFGAGVAYRLWSTRDFGGIPVSNGRLVHAGDQQLAQGAALTELAAGAAISGGSCFTFQTVYATWRWRYFQIYTNGWYTTGWA